MIDCRPPIRQTKQHCCHIRVCVCACACVSHFRTETVKTSAKSICMHIFTVCVSIGWDYRILDTREKSEKADNNRNTGCFFKIKSWPCSRATACSTVNYFIESFVQTSPQGVRTAGFPNYHISVMLGHAKKEMRPISPWQSCRVLNRPASQD